MKKSNLSLIISGLAILLSASILQSCEKEEALVVTEEDAADIIAASFGSQTGGIAHEVAINTEYISEETNELECGSSRTIIKSFVKSEGVNTGNITYNWDLSRNCSSEVTYLNWVGNFNGSFETPRLSGSTSGTRNWLITGFESENNFLTFNGSINRNGSHNSKVRQRRSFSTEISYEFSEVVVSKGTHEIQSGTGTVQISIEGSNGGSKSFSGNITFNGNGSVTVVLNNETFQIITN
ncbi:MAG: hypothetical protein ACFCUU_07160 [Cyclobacteriaceae bacterium]